MPSIGGAPYWDETATLPRGTSSWTVFPESSESCLTCLLGGNLPEYKTFAPSISGFHQETGNLVLFEMRGKRTGKELYMLTSVHGQVCFGTTFYDRARYPTSDRHRAAQTIHLAHLLSFSVY